MRNLCQPEEKNFDLQIRLLREEAAGVVLCRGKIDPMGRHILPLGPAIGVEIADLTGN
jgi:hypothetical protein